MKKNNKILFALGVFAVYLFFNKSNSNYKPELYDGKWFEIPNYDKNPIPGAALPQVLPPIGFFYFSGFGSNDGWYHKVDLEAAGWQLKGSTWYPPQDAANGANSLAAVSSLLDMAAQVIPTGNE